MKRNFAFSLSMMLFLVIIFLFASTIPAAAMEVKVTKEKINIREKPDVNSKILAKATSGTVLKVKEKTGEWYRVLLPIQKAEGESTGYVFHSLVREVKEETKPGVKPEVKATPAVAQTTTEPPKKEIIKPNARKAQKAQKPVKAKAKKKKDKIFLMGMGMIRFNWSDVKGDAIRFRYSDLGLPTDFSTRERASFMVDGTFGHGKYNINGRLNYDPENRITEPPLDFLVTIGNENTYLSVGDYRMGVFLDSVFSRYYHPFRGAILGLRSDRLGIEFIGGLARGESGIEEIPTDSGSGPYYLADNPILRGSENIFLVVKSANNPDLEIKRTPLVRNRDYFIDYDRGSLLFTYSLYPFDELGNPVYLVASYQFESLVGRFSRAVFGMRAFAVPFKFLKLNFSYIADADKDQDLGDIVKNARGIYTFGVNVDSKPLTFFGELSVSDEPAAEKQTGFFGGGIFTISKQLRLFFNSWSVDSEFPTFANKQLQYGYSLFQIFPSYAQRNIFLSPFQFTRNLGAELYPFSLARVSVDENETHGFLEWENKTNRVSLGYGTRNEKTTDLKTNTLYLSSFHNGEKTKAWGKFGIDRTHDADKTANDSGVTDILLGVRQRVKKFSKGEVYVQADYKGDWNKDFLDLYHDSYHQTYSLMAEFLTGTEGLFAGYRKEKLTDKDDNRELLDADIFEVGIRRHLYKGFFVDSRYRKEKSTGENGKVDNNILSLGAGFESKKFRAMARFETQLNKRGEDEGRRKLWSFFFFGSPLKRMSISLRYYHQIGEDETSFSLTERSEEQLSARFLWRPWDFLNLYSQWRYDTNLELYPPLDRTRSNSLAEVHGLKLKLSKKFEFLANYKLLKVWGPIDNRKSAAAAELGYLIFRHFRLAVGIERINFNDDFNTDANYRSTVGYFKLIAIY